MQRKNRLSSLFVASAVGLMSVGLARQSLADINIQVVPSSAPNAYGSPSWSAYTTNALIGLQNNLATVVDRNVDPTGYSAIPNHATIPAGDVMVTSYNSWRGFADPAAPFNNEEGNRLHFGLVATGDGTQQFSLDDVTFTIDSNDPGDSMIYHDDLSGLTYNGTTRIGVNWGPDRAPGGGDDIIYNAGQSGSLPVDQLFYVGVGNAFWPGLDDPDPSNPVDGKQAALNETADYIFNNEPFTITGTYSIDGFMGAADVNVVPEPATLGVIGLAGLALLARRRRSARA